MSRSIVTYYVTIPSAFAGLAAGAASPTLRRMEFGWWARDDEGKKWQISVRFHGGNVTFSRKHGHHTSWEDFEPTDSDWDKLLGEAERRLPRRLMSQKQFDQLKSRRPS